MRRILLLLLLSLPATVLAGPYFVGPYFDSTPTGGGGGGPLPPNVVFGSGTPGHMTVWGPGPNDIQDSVIVIDVVTGDMSAVNDIELVSITSRAATDIDVNPDQAININLGPDAGDDFIVRPSTCSIIAEGDTGFVGVNRCFPQKQLHVGINAPPGSITTAIAANDIAIFDNAAVLNSSATVVVAGNGAGSVSLYLQDESLTNFAQLVHNNAIANAGRTALRSTGDISLDTGDSTAILTRGVYIGQGAQSVEHGSLLEVEGITGGVTLPRLSTANRDAFTAGGVPDGTIIYNDDPAPRDFKFRVNGVWERYQPSVGPPSNGFVSNPSPPTIIDHIPTWADVLGVEIQDPLAPGNGLRIPFGTNELHNVTTLRSTPATGGTEDIVVQLNSPSTGNDKFQVATPGSVTSATALTILGLNSRVGIRTAAPRATIDIVASGAGTVAATPADFILEDSQDPAREARLAIVSGNAAINSQITFGDTDDILEGIIQYDHTAFTGDGQFDIFTNGLPGNSVRINEAANVELNSIESRTDTDIEVILGTDAGDDFIVRGGAIEGLTVLGNNLRVGIRQPNPRAAFDVVTAGAGTVPPGNSDFIFEDSASGGVTEGAIIAIISDPLAQAAGLLFSKSTGTFIEARLTFNHVTDTMSFEVPFSGGAGAVGPMLTVHNTGTVAAFNTNAAPPASAVLEARSSNQGFLPPRNANPGANIPAPVAGLLAYDTTLNCTAEFDGVQWECIGDPDNDHIDGPNPAVSTDDAVMLWDGVNGRLAQNSILTFKLNQPITIPPPGPGNVNRDVLTTSTPANFAIRANAFVSASPMYVVFENESAGDDFIVDSYTLVVESDSNEVGVGLTNPQAKLHVSLDGTSTTPGANTAVMVQNATAPTDSVNMTLVSGTTGSATINFGDTLSVSEGILAYNNATGAMTLGGAGALVMSLEEGTGDDFIIDTDTFVLESDSDQIGLGTTDPRTQLHVLSSGSPTTPTTDVNVYLQASSVITTDNFALIASGGLGVAGWYFGDNGGADGSVVYDNADRDLIFSAGGLTEGMRFTNTGNLGIGETNPTSMLQVKNSGAQALEGANSVAIFQNSALAADSVAIGLLSGNTGTNAIYFGDTNSATVGRLAYDHSVNTITVTLGGGERLKFTPTGSAISDATVVAANAQTVLDLQSTTKALGMPSLTTAGRNNISVTPDEGLLVWNTDTQRLEACDSTGTTACWNAVAASPGTEGLAAFGRISNFTTAPAGQTVDTVADATLLDWTAGLVDSNGLITVTGTPPDLQLTVGAGGAGVYKIRGIITMGASVMGVGEAYIGELFKNGVLIAGAQGASGTQGTSIITIEIDMIAALAVGDDVDLRLRVTTGTETVTITTASIVMNRIEI